VRTFLVLYEASRVGQQPTGAPIESLISRLQPAALRSAQRALLDEALPRDALPPNLLSNPLAPNDGGSLTTLRAREPRVDLALLLLQRPAASSAAIGAAEQRMRAAGEDPEEVRRWANAPRFRHGLEALHIDDAEIERFLQLGGDLERLQPPSRILIALNQAENQGNAVALNALTALFALQRLAAGRSLARLDTQISELGGALAHASEPSERTRLASELATAVRDRRALRSNRSETQSRLDLVRERQGTSAEARLQRELESLRPTLEARRRADNPSPSQAQIDRYTELQQTFPVPTENRAEYDRLRRIVRPYERAAERAQALQTRLRARAAVHESALSRWLHAHPRSSIADAPETLRNRAQDMDDAFVSAASMNAADHALQVQADALTAEGQPQTPESVAVAYLGPAGNITAYGANTFDATHAAPATFAARATQLNGLNIFNPPRHTPPVVGHSARADRRADARDERDQRHQAAMGDRNRVLSDASALTLRQHHVHVGIEATAPRPLPARGQQPPQTPTPDVEAAERPIPVLSAAQAAVDVQATPDAASFRVAASAPRIAAQDLSPDDRQTIANLNAATRGLETSNNARLQALTQMQARDLASADPARLSRAASRSSTITQVNQENARLAQDSATIQASGLAFAQRSSEAIRNAGQQIEADRHELEGYSENNHLVPGLVAQLAEAERAQHDWDTWLATHRITEISSDRPRGPTLTPNQVEALRSRIASLRERITTQEQNLTTLRHNAAANPALVSATDQWLASSRVMPGIVSQPVRSTLLMQDALDASDGYAQAAVDANTDARRALSASTLAASTLAPTLRALTAQGAHVQNWHANHIAHSAPLAAQAARLRVRLRIDGAGDETSSTPPPRQALGAAEVLPLARWEYDNNFGLLPPTDAAARGAEEDASQQVGLRYAARADGALQAAQAHTQNYVRQVSDPASEALTQEEITNATQLVGSTLRTQVSVASRVGAYSPEIGLRWIAPAYQAANIRGPQDMGVIPTTLPSVRVGEPPQAANALPAELQLGAANPLTRLGQAPALQRIARGIREDAIRALPALVMAATSRRQVPTDRVTLVRNDAQAQRAAGDITTDRVPAPSPGTTYAAYQFVRAAAQSRGPENPETAPLRLFVESFDAALARMPAVLRNRAQVVRNSQTRANAWIDAQRVSGREAANANTFVLQHWGQELGITTTPSERQAIYEGDMDGLQARVNGAAETFVQQDEALAEQFASGTLEEQLRLFSSLAGHFQPGTRSESQGIPSVITDPPEYAQQAEREDRIDPFIARTFQNGGFTPVYDDQDRLVGVGLDTSRDSVNAGDLDGSRTYASVRTAVGRRAFEERNNQSLLMFVVNEGTKFLLIEALTFGVGGIMSAARAGMRATELTLEGVEAAEVAVASGRALTMSERVGLALARRGIVREAGVAVIEREGASLINLSGNMSELGSHLGTRMGTWTGRSGATLLRSLRANPQMAERFAAWAERAAESSGRFVFHGLGSAGEMAFVSFVQGHAEAWARENLPRWAQPFVSLGLQVGVNHVQGRAVTGSPTPALSQRVLHGLPWTLISAATPFVVREVMFFGTEGPRSEADEQRLNAAQELWGHVTGIALPSLWGAGRAAIGRRHAVRETQERLARAALGEPLTQASAEQRAAYETAFRELTRALEPAARALVDAPTAPESRNEAAQALEQASERLPRGDANAVRMQNEARRLRREAATLSVTLTLPAEGASEAGFHARAQAQVEAQLERAGVLSAEPTERARQVAHATDAAIVSAAFAAPPLQPFDASHLREPELSQTLDARTADLRDRLTRVGMDPVIAEARALSLLQATIAERAHELVSQAQPRSASGRRARAAQVSNLEAAQQTLAARHETIGPRARLRAQLEATTSLPDAAREPLARDLDALVQRTPRPQQDEFWREYQTLVERHIPGEAGRVLTLAAAYAEASNGIANMPGSQALSAHQRFVLMTRALSEMGFALEGAATYCARRLDLPVPNQAEAQPRADTPANSSPVLVPEAHQATLRQIEAIADPEDAARFRAMFEEMTPQRRAELGPAVEEALRETGFDQTLALDRVRTRFRIGTDVNGIAVFGPGNTASTMPQVRNDEGSWLWADGTPVEARAERRADNGFDFAPSITSSSDAPGSDLAGMSVEHGTAQVYVDSVTAGPQNVGSGLGGRGLYLAVPGDSESAPRFGGRVAERVREGQGRHGALPETAQEGAGDVVLMRGQIQAGRNLRVGRFMVVPEAMVDIPNGRLPANWSDNPSLARQLENEFDVLDIRVPANFTAFGNGRMLVVHERAGRDFIRWSGTEVIQRVRAETRTPSIVQPSAPRVPRRETAVVDRPVPPQAIVPSPIAPRTPVAMQQPQTAQQALPHLGFSSPGPIRRLLRFFFPQADHAPTLRTGGDVDLISGSTAERWQVSNIDYDTNTVRLRRHGSELTVSASEILTVRNDSATPQITLRTNPDPGYVVAIPDGRNPPIQGFRIRAFRDGNQVEVYRVTREGTVETRALSLEQLLQTNADALIGRELVINGVNHTITASRDGRFTLRHVGGEMTLSALQLASAHADRAREAFALSSPTPQDAWLAREAANLNAQTSHQDRRALMRRFAQTIAHVPEETFADFASLEPEQIRQLFLTPPPIEWAAILGRMRLAGITNWHVMQLERLMRADPSGFLLAARTNPELLGDMASSNVLFGEAPARMAARHGLSAMMTLSRMLTVSPDAARALVAVRGTNAAMQTLSGGLRSALTEAYAALAEFQSRPRADDALRLVREYMASTLLEHGTGRFATEQPGALLEGIRRALEGGADVNAIVGAIQRREHPTRVEADTLPGPVRDITGPRLAIQGTRGVASQVYRVQTPEGVFYVKPIGGKNGNAPVSELLAGMLESEMGLGVVPEAMLVRHDGQLAVAMRAVPATLRQAAYTGDAHLTPAFADALSDLQAFDYLLAVGNRHLTNVFAGEDAAGRPRVMGIDNDSAFTSLTAPAMRGTYVSGGMLPETYSLRFREAFARLTPARLRELYARHLTAEQMNALLVRFEILRTHIEQVHGPLALQPAQEAQTPAREAPQPAPALATPQPAPALATPQPAPAAQSILDAPVLRAADPAITALAAAHPDDALLLLNAHARGIDAAQAYTSGGAAAVSAELIVTNAPVSHDARRTAAPILERLWQAGLGNPRAQRRAVYDALRTAGLSPEDAGELARRATLFAATASNNAGALYRSSTASTRATLEASLSTQPEPLRALLLQVFDRFTDPVFFVDQLATLWGEALVEMGRRPGAAELLSGSRLQPNNVPVDAEFDVLRGIFLHGAARRGAGALFTPGDAASRPAVLHGAAATPDFMRALQAGRAYFELGASLGASSHGPDAHFIQLAVIARAVNEALAQARATDANVPSNLRELVTRLGQIDTAWALLFDGSELFNSPDVITSVLDVVMPEDARIRQETARTNQHLARARRIAAEANVPRDRLSRTTTGLAQLEALFHDPHMLVPREVQSVLETLRNPTGGLTRAMTRAEYQAVMTAYLRSKGVPQAVAERAAQQAASPVRGNPSETPASTPVRAALLQDVPAPPVATLPLIQAAYEALGGGARVRTAASRTGRTTTRSTATLISSAEFAARLDGMLGQEVAAFLPRLQVLPEQMRILTLEAMFGAQDAEELRTIMSQTEPMLQ
jgi:hypothetical protein